MISAAATAFAHEISLDLGGQHACTLHALTCIIKLDYYMHVEGYYMM
jgi:hypothetical protein